MFPLREDETKFLQLGGESDPITLNRFTCRIWLHNSCQLIQTHREIIDLLKKQAYSPEV